MSDGKGRFEAEGIYQGTVLNDTAENVTTLMSEWDGIVCARLESGWLSEFGEVEYQSRNVRTTFGMQ